MYLQDMYYFWRLTADLISNHEYELIQLDQERHEVWLEKSEKKKTYVVRIKQHTFDWANHLKRNQAAIAEQVKRLSKSLIGRDIEVKNVYISQFPPIDDWSQAPIHIESRKAIVMNTRFVDQDHREEQINQLYQELGLPEKSFPLPGEDEMEMMVPYLKKTVQENHERYQQEQQQILSRGKPVLTYVLIAVNLLMFFILEMNGGSTNTQTLIQYGAKFNPYIIAGEWWRIVSSMFLHIGVAHIFLNMLALYYLGNAVERMFGSARFFVIYMISGIVGGLASFALSANVAAGASGAIYGLFGSLLFFGLIYKKLFFRTMGSNVIVLLVINIGFSFIVPQIDIGAHLGGLVGGFLASSFVHFPKKQNLLSQGGSLIAILVASAALIFYGLQDHQSYNANTLTALAGQYHDAGHYEKSFEVANDAIENKNVESSGLYFIRSYAYIEQKQYSQAISDLEKSVQLNNQNDTAHYNLSLLYANEGDREKALKHAKRAVELNPEGKGYQNHLDQLEASG